MKKNPLFRMYQVLENATSKHEARDYVVTALDSLIQELEENHEFTEEKFESELHRIAQWTEETILKNQKDKKKGAA